jgi:VCBS repeat-containing protein
VIIGATATGSIPSSVLTATAASYLTANRNLINGLGGGSGFGTNTLGRNDDASSSAINLDSVFGPSGLNFFGHTYHTFYINNNGNITFDGPSSTYTPGVINAGVDNPIIAPFWADVDTRGGSTTPTPGGDSTGSNLVYYNLDPINHVITITWDDVGYFDGHTNKLDAFQLQLISLGNGDFDIVFRYEDINWTTGDASNGHAARAGFSAGDGNSSHAFELSQSGNSAAMLALESTTGNTNIGGVDVFQVQSGNVTSTQVANGTISFADPDSGDTHTASSQPEGNGYIGAFSVDPVNEANQTVGWHFNLNSNDVNTFFNAQATQVRQQFYDVAVHDVQGATATERVGLNVASTASDTFVFAPGAGQEMVFNFNTNSAAADHVELDHFGITNFSSLILQSVNNNHDTLINLGHGDSVTLVNVHPVDLTSNNFILHA